MTRPTVARRRRLRISETVVVAAPLETTVAPLPAPIRGPAGGRGSGGEGPRGQEEEAAVRRVGGAAGGAAQPRGSRPATAAATGSRLLTVSDADDGPSRSTTSWSFLTGGPHA